MDFERHPSGVSFDVRQHGSGLPSDEEDVREPRSQHFHTAHTLAVVASEGHKRYLPLLEVSQDVKVIATTSRTLLAQTFVNYSSFSIQEATYCFPLYDGSVIISFRCWLDGKKLLEGEVKPKGAAKAEYRDAVTRQRVAALLEEHTPEIFETFVGNIPAGTSVKVEITYVNELKVDKGGDGMLVTIPTSIAPRYGTPSVASINASRSPSTVENGLKIQIEVSAWAPIQRLESSTHPISVELGSEGHPTQTDRFGDLATRGFDPKKARASLSDRTAVLGKDFVLLIVASSSHSSPRALIECHPSLPDHSVIMTTIIPREIFAAHLSSKATKGSKADKATEAEIIFVVDRSGSMREKMEALIHALRVLLERIPEECLFNICSFGSQYSLLWTKSRTSKPTNLAHAREHVLTSFRADLGGTELLPALKAMVQQRTTKNGMRTEIIVLTDGEVWNTEATIDFVRTSRKSANNKIRFFALGIGNAVSHRLVEGIGREGGGYAEVVAVDSHGQCESRVIRMLNGALTPCSWQCKISLERKGEPYLAQIGEDTKSGSGKLLDSKLQKPVCVQAPFRIPTLHAFSRLSVYFIINRKIPLENSVKIQAVASTGEVVEVLLPLERVGDQPATIHFLAAKALMNDFETEQSWLHSEYQMLKNKHPIGFEEIVRQEAEIVGQKWSITGKWTSFIAIDQGNKLKNEISLYKPKSSISELTAPLRSPDPWDYYDRVRSDCSRSVQPRKRIYPADDAEGRLAIESALDNYGNSSVNFDQHNTSTAIEPASHSSDYTRSYAAGMSRALAETAEVSVTHRTRTVEGSLSSSGTFALPQSQSWKTLLTRSLWPFRKGKRVYNIQKQTRKEKEFLITLISEQTSLGCFPLKRPNSRETVLESFRPELLSEFEDLVSKTQRQGFIAPSFLVETVIVVVYIEKKVPKLFRPWDFGVKNARDWVRENVKDDSIREGFYSLVQDNFRDEPNIEEIESDTGINGTNSAADGN